MREKLMQRVHLVEAMLRLVDDRHAFVDLVAAAADRHVARDTLISEWGLSDLQANYVLDMGFGRLTQLGRQALSEELVELREQLDQASE